MIRESVTTISKVIVFIVLFFYASQSLASATAATTRYTEGAKIKFTKKNLRNKESQRKTSCSQSIDLIIWWKVLIMSRKKGKSWLFHFKLLLKTKRKLCKRELTESKDSKKSQKLPQMRIKIKTRLHKGLILWFKNYGAHSLKEKWKMKWKNITILRKLYRK